MTGRCIVIFSCAAISINIYYSCDEYDESQMGNKKKKTKMENSGQHGRKVCISFNITRKKYLGEIILEVAWKIESQMTYWGGHERLLTQNKELGFLTKTKHSDERAAEGCWWRKRTQKQYNSIIQK